MSSRICSPCKIKYTPAWYPALDVKVSNEERAKSITHSTENISAYELYVKGRSLLGNRQRDEQILKQAFDLFLSATQKDSHFALAYTGMADAG